jgi:hypothetical protein
VSIRFFRQAAGILLLAVLVISGTETLCRQAAAQQINPVMVVSLSGSNKLLGDIVYLTNSAGAGDAGQFVALMAGPYTAPLDPDRPAGVYVTMQEGSPEPVGIVFLPVKDLDALLRALELQVGQPEDVGDGVLAIATDRPQPVYVKKAGKWAFFSNKKEQLSSLPKNPAKLLGDLPEQYTLAVRVHVANIPEQFRQMAVDQLRRGFDEQMDDEAPEARELGEMGLKSVTDLIEGIDELTIGMQVDSEKETSYLDVSLTALPDTQLAAQMANVRENRSTFSGFQMDDAALTFHAHGKSTPEEIKQAVLLLDRVRAEAMKGIDKDRKLSAAEKEQVKGLVGQLIDIGQATVSAGEMDCGAAFMLHPESLSIAVGGFVADGDKLASTLKELAAIVAEKEPKFPTIQFDAQKHKGVTFHTTNVPIDQSDAEARQARELLGDPMDVVVGTGKTSAYLSLGRDAAGLLKKVLDGSESQTSLTFSPGELVISMTPILETAAAMEGQAPVIAAYDAVKSSGNDQISAKVLPIKQGATLRLEIQSGVLKAVGAATQARGR